jgi:hypothetical protein
VTGGDDMTRELIECYYDMNEQAIFNIVEVKQGIQDAEAGLAAEMEEMQTFIDMLGHEFWHKLDQITTAQNAVEAEVAKEMYIRGFLDYERLVCRNEEGF